MWQQRFIFSFVNLLIISKPLIQANAEDDNPSFTIVQQEGNSEGDPSCPCLNELTHVNTPKNYNGSCLDVPFIKTSSGGAISMEEFCYPLSYGTTCAAHDANMGPFCDGPNQLQLFCNAPFCYIDPQKCKSSANNSYFRSSIFPFLFFSYSTCGAKSDWEKFVISNQLRGSTVHVGVPALYYPDNFKLDIHGNPIMFDTNLDAGVSGYKGIMIELLEAISEKANFTIVYEAPSAGAIAENGGDTFSACVQDVGRGLLDMCVSNFWETTQRRQMTQFTTTIFSENFYMVVPLPQIDNSLAVEITKLLRPFSNDLWLTILIATIGVGLSYTILDSTRKPSSCKNIFGRIFEYIYVATLELMTNSTNLAEEQYFYYKSVTLTWAFFVLIILSAYTANLAAFLGRNKAVFNVKSVDDCIEKNCNLCFESSLLTKTELKRQFPLLRRFQELDWDKSKISIHLADGTCDAVVVSKYAWEMTEAYWGDCKTMFLGDFTHTFKVGWPVSLSVSESVSYWLGSFVEEGLMDDLTEKYQPVPRCAEPDLFDEEDEEVEQLGVKSMAGPLTILGAGIAFGLFCKFGRDCLNKREKRKSKLNTMFESISRMTNSFSSPPPLPVIIMENAIEDGKNTGVLIAVEASKSFTK